MWFNLCEIFTLILTLSCALQSKIQLENRNLWVPYIYVYISFFFSDVVLVIMQL